MKKIVYICIIILSITMSCKKSNEMQETSTEEIQKNKKVVVYQVFTRLFGNTNTTNKPWGTITENGVGKFNDFTDKALSEIKDLGVTHIWYTGVLHHATATDYTQNGISNDDPDVIKGRAGSPYAVKDYYQVNPDLAEDPSKRLEEFEALIKRSHKQGLKVIIDIVPNHIARQYEGLNNPTNVVDFGANDNSNVVYDVNNNFYYVVGEDFKVPHWQDGYLPLGGENNAFADGKFKESPAKWTGNGSRSAQPNFYDWYETVKINYGVNPDGHYDFEQLPNDFGEKDFKAHFEFWQGKKIPDSWVKFRDIALFWLEKGVDGFRYDMAEMVPVEFWSYMNASIKMKNSEAFLLAEVYNPQLYRDYLFKGKMDYLYDKVGLYDSIKKVMRGEAPAEILVNTQAQVQDVEHHMLHFLENHDEQRIASPEFAGKAEKGKPAMVVSATLSTSPTMIYFGQSVGEPGAEHAGFGHPSRTSIFDYIGVPEHQKWLNNKQFDGGQLNQEQKELRAFYKSLLNFTINSDALMGSYADIQLFNVHNNQPYHNKIYAFTRWSENEKLIILANFSESEVVQSIKIPAEIIQAWQLTDGTYEIKDQLLSQQDQVLTVENGEGKFNVTFKALESFIFKLK